MAAPYITAAQVGSYFVTQYYPMLQQTPNFVHRLYSDASTMIRVDGRGRETASGMMQIHTLIMSMPFTSIEINTAHSLESWNGGVIIMVTGSVQLNDCNAKKKFAQTFFLAPQEKGFFVINDIFHFMDEDPIHSCPASSFALSDADTKMSVPPSIQDSVPSYSVSGQMTTSWEYMHAPDIKENGVTDQFSMTEMTMQQQVNLDDSSVEHGNDNGFLEAPQDSVQQVPSRIEESIGEPQRHTYASILRVAKGQPVASTVHPSNQNTLPAPDWQYTQPNNQPGNLEFEQPGVNFVANEGFGVEASEDSAIAYDKGEMKSVYVRGLSATMCASEIEEEFKKFGGLGPEGVAIRQVKDTDVCYAFVEFEDISGVQNAVEAATVEVAGRQLYIEERRANSSSARGRRGRRGRGSFSTETSRGRFGGRSSYGRNGEHSDGVDSSRGRGNGYHRQTPTR